MRSNALTLVAVLFLSPLLSVMPIFVPSAGAATTTIFLTSTSVTSWTVPSDWNSSNNSVSVIGGGGGGKTNIGSAGGGGAYSSKTNITLTPGASVTYQVGAGGSGTTGGTGEDTYFNGSGTTCATQSVCAKGGGGAVGNTSPGAGGAAASGVGTTKYSGGAGAGSNGGGGGAAGLHGAGTVGSASGAGGSGDAGFGGAGGSANGDPGSPGTEWDATHGSGGGGAGRFTAATGAGSAGGSYGGGGGASYGNAAGGAGVQGLIVITYTPDTTAPTPNPSTFSSAPAAAGATSITMTASTATDAAGSTPVQYYFTYTACGSNPGTGGTDSGWQTSATYTDSGLAVNKCYGYTTKSEDSFANVTTASSVTSVYTLANAPGTPTLSNQSNHAAIITNAENGNPSNTLFAIQVSATSPTDSTWNAKYIDANGNPSATAVWLADSTWDGLVIYGLTPGTQYTIQSKAKNGNAVETAFSSTNSITTLESAVKTLLLFGNILLFGVKLF